MKRICLFTLCIVIGITANAQTLKAKLDAAIKQLEKDAQVKHGLIGFSVIDAATGKPVYERNADIGLAPASTQKIFTSIATFEILGKDYRYKTSFSFNSGKLYVSASGDPTLGSWRFSNTKRERIIANVIDAYKKKGIKEKFSAIVSTGNSFDAQSIPDGWIWEDIGNYYGAGHDNLNWNENQYDLILKPGKNIGDSVEVQGTDPQLNIDFITNELKTGAKGSGDNAYIYFGPASVVRIVRGTVPCCVDSFTISGSVEGWRIFYEDILAEFQRNGITRGGFEFIPSGASEKDAISLYEHSSPTFDSINFYFLKRSINLYGEALLRTIAKEKSGFGSSEKGIELIKGIFEKIGIEKSAIDIIDGCGLSPQNRVTTNSLTKALYYAKSRPWFGSFYYALPEINGMKMKSGLIGGVRSYAGYQKAANGKEYIFSIIINNYTGSSSEMNKKLFKILDYLK